MNKIQPDVDMRVKVAKALFSALDEINEQLPKNRHLEKSLETVLFGKSGRLDSLGLVHLIVTVEQKISEDFEVTITLADEKAVSQKNSPFRTIGTLANYICLLLEKSPHE